MHQYTGEGQNLWGIPFLTGHVASSWQGPESFPATLETCVVSLPRIGTLRGWRGWAVEFSRWLEVSKMETSRGPSLQVIRHQLLGRHTHDLHVTPCGCAQIKIWLGNHGHCHCRGWWPNPNDHDVLLTHGQVVMVFCSVLLASPLLQKEVIIFNAKSIIQYHPSSKPFVGYMSPFSMALELW